MLRFTSEEPKKNRIGKKTVKSKPKKTIILFNRAKNVQSKQQNEINNIFCVKLDLMTEAQQESSFPQMRSPYNPPSLAAVGITRERVPIPMLDDFY